MIDILHSGHNIHFLEMFIYWPMKVLKNYADLYNCSNYTGIQIFKFLFPWINKLFLIFSLLSKQNFDVIIQHKITTDMNFQKAAVLSGQLFEKKYGW